jgi:hypothetical protein
MKIMAETSGFTGRGALGAPIAGRSSGCRPLFDNSTLI